MKTVGLIGRGICQRYECMATSATAPQVHWVDHAHEIAEWRADAGHTTLVIVMDCAHDFIIEFRPGALWSRIRRLGHTQFECAAIAAGWAAIVGLDGQWIRFPRRVTHTDRET
jgi:hypothetical protein